MHVSRRGGDISSRFKTLVIGIFVHNVINKRALSSQILRIHLWQLAGNVGFCYLKALQSGPSQSRCQSLSSSAALRPWPACICEFMSPRLLAGPIKNSTSCSLARWPGGNSSLRRHKLNWGECRRRTFRLKRHKLNIMYSNE
jgi:hypothetical protein